MSVQVADKVHKGTVKVVYDIPPGLDEGEYYWSLGITRNLPYNTKRFGVMESNVFLISSP
jgi:hypothetical protein